MLTAAALRAMALDEVQRVPDLLLAVKRAVDRDRDLQVLSSIDNLVDSRRLTGAACLRLGQLVNRSELGRDVQLPQPTVRRWLNLLEASYQLVPVVQPLLADG